MEKERQRLVSVYREMVALIATQVPPKTNSWKSEENETMIEDTIQYLSRLFQANKNLAA